MYVHVHVHRTCVYLHIPMVRLEFVSVSFFECGESGAFWSSLKSERHVCLSIKWLNYEPEQNNRCAGDISILLAAKKSYLVALPRTRTRYIVQVQNKGLYFTALIPLTFVHV